MVYISENYSNDRLLGELRKIRPEIELGDRVRVTEVDASDETGIPSIDVTLRFALTREEWRQVLDASRI